MRTHRPSFPAMTERVSRLSGGVALIALLLAASGCPAPAPTASAGCTKDADCKGNRVCSGGACVEPPHPDPPHPPPQPPPVTPPPQPPTPPPPSGGGAGPRALDDTERADLGRALSKFDVDFSQTFRLSLNGFGDCTFASTIYKENGEHGFLIVQGGRVVHVLPKNAETESMRRTAVRAVSFTSIDGDPYTDIVVVADYKPHRARPATMTSFYHGTSGRSFTFDGAASRTATAAGASSIAAAKKAIGR